MDVTSTLLLIYAGIMIVFGLFVLIDSKSAGDMFDEIISSKSIGRIWALTSLVLGIVTLGVGYQIVWEGYAWVLPLMGWASLIKGVLFFWWPNFFWGSFKTTATSNIIVAGLISTIVGILLLFLVF